jgi:hypothetical protein
MKAGSIKLGDAWAISAHYNNKTQSYVDKTFFCLSVRHEQAMHAGNVVFVDWLVSTSDGHIYTTSKIYMCSTEVMQGGTKL